MSLGYSRLNSVLGDNTDTLQDGQFAAKVKNLIAQKVALEASAVGKAAKTERGGVKSLAAVTDDDNSVSDKAVCSIATNNLKGVELEKQIDASTQADIETLTGGAVTNGQLTAMILQGNVEGVQQAMTLVLNANESQVQEAAKEVTTVESVITTAVTTPPDQAVAAQAQTQVTDLSKNLNLNFGNQNAFGSIGASFGNILGALSANLTNSKDYVGVGTQIADATSSYTDPVSGEISQDNIVNSDGNTNLSTVVDKGSSVVETSPTDKAFDVLENAALWKGALTIGYQGDATGGMDRRDRDYAGLYDQYHFEIISSFEEFEADFAAGQFERELTHMQVSHIGAPSDFEVSMPYLQEIITDKQAIKYKEKAAGYEDLADLGMNIHYYIKKDGRVYRGRPITLDPAPFVKWYKGAVRIVFEAGSTQPQKNKNYTDYYSADSITPDQWKAFDYACLAFLRVVPGGEIVSWDKVNPDKEPNPGFDAQDYVKTKFNKETIYDTEDFEKENPWSAAEMVERPAKSVVVIDDDPTKPPTVNDLKKLSDEINKIDPSTGKIKDYTADEVRDLQKQYDDAIDRMKQTQRSKDGLYTPAIINQGSGLLGSLSGTGTNLTNSIDSFLKTGASIRNGLIDQGYTYNPITKEWTK